MKVVTLSAILAGLLAVTGMTSHAATTATPFVIKHSTISILVADAHEVWTRGTVVRVSTARGKVTIEHEPIENLDMMAMTMPFSAGDTALLDGLKPGDVIEFIAVMNGDELILKKLRRAAS